tara:strand:- start:138 stop:506 length:369 start_codon:yes stop_codon:yes gene_type:complete
MVRVNPTRKKQKTKNNFKKQKFTNQVLVRALDTKPGWIEIFFLQESAQTISLNQYIYIYIQKYIANDLYTNIQNIYEICTKYTKYTTCIPNIKYTQNLNQKGYKTRVDFLIPVFPNTTSAGR